MGPDLEGAILYSATFLASADGSAYLHKKCASEESPRDPMSHLRLTVLLLVAALVVGCMNMSSTLTVRPDGSGTVSERLTVSPEFAKMMRKMQQMNDSTSSSGALFSEEEIQARADSIPGLHLKSTEMISGPEGEGYEAIYRFDNLNEVQLNPSPDDVLPERPEDQNEEDAPFDLLSEVDFSHTPGSPATLSITMPRSEEQDVGVDTPGEGPPSDQQVQMMRDMMSDSGFRLAVTVEGEIVETNASHRSESTITLMEMDFGTLTQDSSAFRKVVSGNQQSVSSRATIDSLNALPGITIEPEETVTIRYE